MGAILLHRMRVLLLSMILKMFYKTKQQVKNNLKTLEDVWNDYQVYLNDEINFIDDEPIIDYSLRKEDE